MMHYVYMLECEDGSYYTGYTNHLEKRFQAHISGHGAKYTRSHHPVSIVYYEEYEDQRTALSREWHLKRLSHDEKKRLAASFARSGKAIETTNRISDNEINNKENLNRMREFRVYKCNKCGKIITTLHESACSTICCGEEMSLLKANTEDAAQEKHVPTVTREGNKLTVNVGSVDHPMIEKHYIEWIALVSDNGFRIAYLNPGDRPCADFLAEEPAKAVYAYCNLHGLWKTEV